MPMSPTHTSIRAAVLVALAAAPVLLSACGDDDDTERPRRTGPTQIELTIGNSAPLTGSLREFGPDAKRAAQLAVAQISAAIKQGGFDHDVDLVTVDNGSNPQRAEETARQLIAEN